MGTVLATTLGAVSEWTGGPAGLDVWRIAAIVASAVFAALVALLVVRAALRQRRYRVVDTFGDEDRAAVRAAVIDAERRTVGEILPVVVERSDPHPAAEWLAALTFVIVGSAALAAVVPWTRPALVVLSQLVLGGAGFGLARALPGFKRAFISEDRATAVAHEQALQEFYAHGLHRTEGATGVLLFVSLLEHRAIVLADEGIDSRVHAEFWADTDDVVLDGIRRGSVRDGLVAGVRRAGELLAEHFPWQRSDRNEIPDRVIARRE